jgi:hypothetical protein
MRTEIVDLGQENTHDHPEVRSGTYVLLAVSDTGVGMEEQAKVICLSGWGRLKRQITRRFCDILP